MASRPYSKTIELDSGRTFDELEFKGRPGSAFAIRGTTTLFTTDR